MADLFFLIGPSEQRYLLEKILATGAVFYPDTFRDDPLLVSVNSADEIERFSNEKWLVGPFVIVWEGISVYPIETSSVRRKEGLKYSIRQRQGGPYMHITLCRKMMVDGNPFLRIGELCHYSRFIINSFGDEIPAPKELKSLYQKFVRIIRSFSIKVVSPGGRSYLVGKEALDLLKSGYNTNTTIRSFLSDHLT